MRTFLFTNNCGLNWYIQKKFLFGWCPIRVPDWYNNQWFQQLTLVLINKIEPVRSILLKNFTRIPWVIPLFTQWKRKCIGAIADDVSISCYAYHVTRVYEKVGQQKWQLEIKCLRWNWLKKTCQVLSFDFHQSRNIQW